MQSTEPARVSSPPATISLVPRALTARESAWLSLVAVFGGLLVWLFVDSFAVGVLLGGVMRTALPMVVGTSGESRRFAILINALIYGGLLAILGLAYNYRLIADLLS